MKQLTELTPSVLKSAKRAFITRRVNRSDVRAIERDLSIANAGDLLVCEIVEIGQHKKIQLAERRASASYPGDIIVLCLGDRYAPDQFHASASIDSEFLDLAAGGGIAGRVDAAHDFMDEPTKLRPLGVLTRQNGKPINFADDALPKIPPNHDVTVVGVFGASMNSGKTTAASSLAHGLNRVRSNPCPSS